MIESNEFNPITMRKELLYNPRILLERIAEESKRIRRVRKLKNTFVTETTDGHLTTLEFIELARDSYKLKVAYDIGANVGSWTQLAKALVPELEVHGFEPIPKFQEKYIRATKNIPNTSLHKVGLGNSDKEATMCFAGDATSFYELGPLLTSFFPSVVKSGEETVNMVRLDDYVEKNHLPFPDIMKLDIEGYEVEALKGAVKCMAHCKYLILEVSFVERHIGQPLFPEVVYFLAQHGFHILSFPVQMHTAQKIYWTDVLFENRNIA